ncbi:hypothetical protein V6N11_030696 [Hibiscus sabdariffa]|uniref:Reverse transcriptase zinc-binding domain-containing protein n=1 Tax=Hibiscus sabdariffa TaxID=183260 RepID=A0ABR1ZVK3_9ROSI
MSLSYVQNPVLGKCWMMVWSDLVPRNVECFMWKVIHGRIPTKSELAKRGLLNDNDTRDHSGKVIVKFSKSIGHSDPVPVELLAIKEALAIFSSLNLSKLSYLEVESDSNNVLCWVQKPYITFAVFKDLISAFLNVGSKFSWGISLIRRSQNGEVDSLAKASINHRVQWIKFGSDGN